MLLIQIVIVAAAVFAIVMAFGRRRRGDLSLRGLLLWSLLWTGAAVASIVPRLTTLVAGWLGVGRGVDAVFYFALILLFYLIFRIFVRLEIIEHEITSIVRELGLKNLGKADSTEE